MIIKYPHHKLREISDDVYFLKESDYIESLVKELIVELKAVGGQGLSAPQVGKSKRVFVLLIEGEYKEFINPQIVMKSKRTDKLDEYCLSLPGEVVNVERSVQIVCYYTTQHYCVQTETFEGLMARAIQHEIEHLDGVLITDYGV